MASGLELFYWHRPEDGYEWQDAKPVEELQNLSFVDSKETRFLIPRPMNTPRHMRYNPLVKHPTLYREFAALEPTEDAFTRFANAYGDLGVGVFIQRSGPFMGYDPLCRWRDAHLSMRPLVDVLNAIQVRDLTTLRQWFSIVDGGAKYQRTDEYVNRWAWIAIPNEHKEYLWEWAMRADSDDDALVRIAQGWTQNEINSAMSASEKGTLTSTRVIFDHDRESMTLHVTPRTLLGALWFQCARVLTLNPTFRSCEHCGKWFELSAESRRKHSKYCSGRCKVAAYRARKASSAESSTEQRLPS